MASGVSWRRRKWSRTRCQAAAKVCWLAGGQQVMQRGLLEEAARVLPRLLLLLQLVAQRHQLIHLGHNPPLLGQGGKREWHGTHPAK